MTPMNLFETIKTVTNSELDAFDMSYYPQKYSKTNNADFARYYSYNSGQEHYRFLTYISDCMENQTVLDIGTLHGWSAIALGSNKKTKVVSFDLPRSVCVWGQQECVQYIQEPNITFRLENILENGNNDALILESPFIFLDTVHDGIFEREFVQRLVDIGYKGVVAFDDIHLLNCGHPCGEAMREFWNSIQLTKYDATGIGHGSGTGIVLFE